MITKSASQAPKKILIINQRPPYGCSLARESLDAALAASAYEQDLSLLFIGDGVFQLKSNQDPSALEMKSLSATYPVLSLYDIEKVYVQKRALAERQLTEADLAITVQYLEDTEITQLMEAQDILLSF